MDIFLEYIVKKGKTQKDMIFIFFIILSGIMFTLVAGFISILFAQLGSIGFMLIAGAWFGVYWLITSKNFEYEYSVTNGEIDIDSIISRRKRKRVLSARTKEIVICASVHDVNFKDELANSTYATTTLMAASYIDAAGTYFADLTSRDGQKVRLYFEPTAKMLSAFQQYNPRAVHIMSE